MCFIFYVLYVVIFNLIYKNMKLDKNPQSRYQLIRLSAFEDYLK